MANSHYNVSFEDIRRVYLPALRHRVLLNFEAQAENIASDTVLAQILNEVSEKARHVRRNRRREASGISCNRSKRDCDELTSSFSRLSIHTSGTPAATSACSATAARILAGARTCRLTNTHANLLPGFPILFTRARDLRVVWHWYAMKQEQSWRLCARTNYAPQGK